ncbi:hypothetical protein ACQKNX_00005 [Lysinibacillus sp. NPDC093712]|uniref:hypothetical protein n=1 Tax=Lysinibacillus sp. NPDC093712 TaxID=3390579 RepID=UPI003CFDFA99
MTKKQLSLFVLFIVCIVFLSFHMNSFKKISLANDMLNDINFDKVNSGFVVDSASGTIRDLDEEKLTTLLSTLKTIDLKPVQKRSESVAMDYIVSLSGSGGAFKLYISTDGSISLENKLEETYQVVDNKMFDTLLHMIT